MDEALQEKLTAIFISESQEIIESFEQDLMSLEQDPDQEERVKNILRSAHTLKGSSGMVNKDILPEYIHSFEEVIKTSFQNKDKHAINFNFLLEHLDYINNLIDQLVRQKGTLDRAVYDEKLAALNNYTVGMGGGETKQSASFGFFEDDSKKKHHRRGKVYYRITFQLEEKRIKNSWTPEQILDDLKKAGKIINIKSQPYQEIDWEKADFSQCYFYWIIVLETEFDEQEVNDLFMFFKKDNKISVEKLKPEQVALLGEIFVSNGKLDKEELEDILETRSKIGEVLIDNKKITKDDLSEALTKQKQIKSEIKVADEIKIATVKVDQLIDIVGELVIANSNLNNIQKKYEDLDFDQVTYNINKISRQLRDLILTLKMVPIGQLLTRFFRIVRDLSKEFGKEIQLLLEGESTELDKTMFTLLQEPLLHLIRNSVDHGLETPQVREQLGKPRSGKIIVRALHESGQIIIEIEDDGKGLNRDKILKKGIEKGLFTANREYSDDQIYNIIFESGFSTKEKEQVNLVSGRGIGMDAVMTGIKKLNGSIQIKSKPGQGTVFSIKLPMTLAIIEGFLIRIGVNFYVIPLHFISECFEVKLENLAEDRKVYDLRGAYLSIIHLNHFFNHVVYDDTEIDQKHVVVLQLDQEKVGVVIDQIIGNHQAVIKPLQKMINDRLLFTGSTILGDGSVALIIDVLNLFLKLKTL